MHQALLAYGYDGEVDVDEAQALLPTAAQLEGRLHQASAAGLLDGPDARDPQYQLSLLGLHVEPWGDGHRDQAVIACRIDITELDDLVGPDLAEPVADGERERLNSVMKTLGLPADDEPGWMRPCRREPCTGGGSSV
ncbi:hypothetical protein [Micromonospora endolithica]|uniref:hypothetical protein n=1 Tax=Micromonospora endolithica TaxID=230091 RepID=UPI0011BDD18F|nr:hypothetical protein [Micromonospora endolithica]